MHPKHIEILIMDRSTNFQRLLRKLNVAVPTTQPFSDPDCCFWISFSMHDNLQDNVMAMKPEFPILQFLFACTKI